MSKFSSFVVFALGFVIIAVTLVTIVRKEFFPEPPPPPEERTVVPKSDLPPLEAGTRDQFLSQLDRLFTAGGLEAVHDYVEKEWVPGRLVQGSIFNSADAISVRIIDRELRRCDPQGATLMEKDPILTRVTPDLRIGQKGRFETWTRVEKGQSFNMTVWFMAE